MKVHIVYMPYIPIPVIALLIFAYMRNSQAKRNDKMRERFWKREEELKELLSKNDNKLNNKEDES
jgi:hypothetical protein